MKFKTKAIIALVYVLSYVYSFGTAFAYFQGRFAESADQNRAGDYFFAATWSLGGPFSAASGVFLSEFNRYGWRVQ